MGKPNRGHRVAWCRFAALGIVGASAFAISPMSLAFVSPGSQAKQRPVETPSSPKLTEDEKIVHVLNRLGFGPRPDDIEKVKRIGLHAYIEQQLHPEQVDDSAVEQKLQTYTELNAPDDEIEGHYNAFITADQAMNKLRREIRLAAAQRPALTATPSGSPATMTDTMTTPAAGTSGQSPFITARSPANAGSQTPAATRQAMRDIVSDDPVLQKEFLDQRDELARTAEPIGLLHEEFDAAKLIRAVESQRQLQEVLVDFWSNHFNIDIRKAPCGVLKVIDDRDVIRPHIWGKFRDLLEASAKSPAMLVYLDNFQSVSDQLPTPNFRRRAALSGQAQSPFIGGGQTPAARPQTIQPPKRKIGLNENYAREIMELHTLGVDGGYTQQDVHEVARCFTGWGIGFEDGARRPLNRYAQAGVFQFHPRVHDDGEKVVIGHRIPAGGGMRDGEIVLDLLAEDRATWRHISYQLCQRLVCDEPPASLVDKCVLTWQNTDGDLREIVRTIVGSPEFFSPMSVHRKIKSPFEYAVSSVRALDGTLDPDALVARRQVPREANSLVRPPQGGGYLDLNANTLLGQIGTMGEPIFQYQAPTGFPEDSRKWVSSGALISRLNFSLALTQGRLADVKLEDPAENAGVASDPNEMIDRASQRILHGEISPSTRATLLRESKADTGTPATPATIAALLLGSPEFQRR